METESPKDPNAPAVEKKDADGDVAMKEPEKPKTRKETRRKTFYTNVGIIVTYNCTPADVLEKQIKIEQELQNKDADAIAKAHAKNAVETSVYKSREKLAEVWRDFATPEEAGKLTELLQQVENWLYEEGEDETKEVYDKRLSEINALTAPLARRAYEWDNVPPAMKALEDAIQNFRAAATSGDEKYAHIPKEDIDKVLKECDDAQNSVQPKLEAYHKRTKTSDPVILSSDTIHRTQNITSICNTILSKPKPAPAPQPAPPQPAQPAQPQQQEQSQQPQQQEQSKQPPQENAEAKMETTETSKPPSNSGENMDTTV